jgi:CDP-2,3-bis-(O-geranylgeranyl)-sn-glycerol synthase
LQEGRIIIEGIMLAVMSAIINAFWIMIPAYIPNSAAAVIKGRLPMDFGKTMADGRRVIGDGKTFRGFFGGIFCGILAGCVQIWACHQHHLDFLPQHTLLSVTLLSVGSMMGDVAASFLKRRRGRQRGEKWPFVDQYDFLIGAFILLIVCNWSWVHETIATLTFIVIIIMTPLLHRAINMIGYKLGFKDVPW